MGLALMMALGVLIMPIVLLGWLVASIVGLILKPRGSKAAIFGVITAVVFYAFMFNLMTEMVRSSFTNGAGNDERYIYCMILAILSPCLGVLVAKFISMVDPKNSKSAKKPHIRRL